MFTPDTPGIANASINGGLILRPYATFPHPNVLAGYLLCSFLLCITLFRSFGTVLSKALIVSSLFISSLALFLTFSRITILAWFMLLFVLILKKIIQQKNLRSVISVVVGILLILFVLTVFFPLLMSRFLHTSLTEQSVVQRALLNQETAIMIDTHLLFGVGLGNFLPTLAVKNQLLSLTFGLQPVHNIFLYVAAETGIIGFMLFCWLLFQTYFHNWKMGAQTENLQVRELHFGFGLLLLLVLFTGMFDHYWLTLQQGQLLFSCIIGLCLSEIQANQ
jgi:O-antigen ligase